jgi:sulfite reductase beta subunit-like hemoprotein
MTDGNLAPYPTSAEEVTAEKLARHLAVAAQHSFRTTMDATEPDRAAMTVFVHEWGIVFLLRELQERAGTHVADAVARQLWESWEDGGGLGEFLWEWLTEYGIDPEAVTR